MVIFLVLCFVITLEAKAGIINEPEVYGNVTPISGSLYLTHHAIEDLDNYSYYYKFNLSNLDTDTIERCEYELVLKIFDLSNTTSIPFIQNKVSCSDLVFKVNFAEIFKELKTPLLGKLRYKLIDQGKGKVLGEFEGPEIFFNFKNEKTEKIDTNLYNYSVDVVSLLNGSKIDIIYSNGDGKWHRYHDPKVYNSTDKQWMTLKWTRAPYFHRLEFVESLDKEEVNSSLYIDQLYLENTANSQVIYNIFLVNNGDINAENVNVSDTLPANMEYISYCYTDCENETLAEPTRINNTDGTTTLTWSIGDLSSVDSKTIQLIAKYIEVPNFAGNKVKASGSKKGIKFVVTSEVAKPVLSEGVG